MKSSAVILSLFLIIFVSFLVQNCSMIVYNPFQTMSYSTPGDEPSTTFTPIATPTPSPTLTPSLISSVTPTVFPGISATPQNTPDSTPTPSISESPSPTVTPTMTPTSSPSPTPTGTPTGIPTATPTATPSATPTATVIPKRWYHPVSENDYISPNGGSAAYPQVAMDNNDNAIITWNQDAGGNNQIFISEYRMGEWAHPFDITAGISLNVSGASNPDVAMDDNGNAVVAWQQPAGISDKIYISEYRSGIWSHPADSGDNVDSSLGSSQDVDIALANNDTAVLTWAQMIGSEFQILKGDYTGGSWSYDDMPINPGSTFSIQPRVAMNASGDAVVVWLQMDGNNNYQVFVGEYRDNTWIYPASTADYISVDNSTDVANADVAMDDDGNVIIVWQQKAGTHYQVFMSEYRASTWSHPTNITDNISPDGRDALFPKVAMDDNDNAIITWHQPRQDGMAAYIFMSEYRNGTWTHPISLSDNISLNNYTAVFPKVAMSNNGDAVITWVQHTSGENQILFSEYRNNGWRHPSLVADKISVGAGDAANVEVAMDNSGCTIIVWQQLDDTVQKIYKSEFR